eukprot:196724-Pleurochrysis_carterae.AAC.1
MVPGLELGFLNTAFKRIAHAVCVVHFNYMSGQTSLIHNLPMPRCISRRSCPIWALLAHGSASLNYRSAMLVLKVQSAWCGKGE